jgi:hypothetical protein
MGRLLAGLVNIDLESDGANLAAFQADALESFDIANEISYIFQKELAPTAIKSTVPAF